MQMTYAYANSNADHRQFFQTARHHICRKATSDAHNLKFPVAIFENYQNISPRWRPHLLASTVFYLHGPQTEDNHVVQQVTG